MHWFRLWDHCILAFPKFCQGMWQLASPSGEQSFKAWNLGISGAGEKNQKKTAHL